jgi:hypothetical protein
LSDKQPYGLKLCYEFNGQPIEGSVVMDTHPYRLIEKAYHNPYLRWVVASARRFPTPCPVFKQIICRGLTIVKDGKDELAPPGMLISARTEGGCDIGAGVVRSDGMFTFMIYGDDGWSPGMQGACEGDKFYFYLHPQSSGFDLDYKTKEEYQFKGGFEVIEIKKLTVE